LGRHPGALKGIFLCVSSTKHSITLQIFENLSEFRYSILLQDFLTTTDPVFANRALAQFSWLWEYKRKQRNFPKKEREKEKKEIL